MLSNIWSDMNKILRLLCRNPCRNAAILLAFAPIAMLGGAFAFEHFGNLQPCILCIYQRWFHAIAAVLAMAAILALFHPGVSRSLLALAALTLLAGAGVAAFHVGVEMHWWEGTSSCGSTSQPSTLADLRAQLLAQPIVRCDEVAWSLFGISMAGYNLLASTGLAVIGLVAAAQKSRNAETGA